MTPYLTRPYLDSVPAGPGIIVAAPGGGSDDAPALQRCIDAAAEARNGGIVFVRGGEYRIGRTLNVWRGVRLIGAGSGRATFTWTGPSAGSGQGRVYLLHFRNFREDPEADADNTTFFSGAFGIDFFVAEGSPGVAAVRFRVAQHSVLRQCGFFAGPDSVAVEAAGHLIEECHFVGGATGVLTGRTSASWPLCLRRCLFEGQTEAAVASARAGVTAEGCVFRAQRRVFAPYPDAPCDVEWLFARGCRFENVSAAVVERDSPVPLETAVTMEESAALDVAVLLRMGAETVGVPAERVYVRSLRHGCHVREGVGQEGAEPLADVRTEADFAPLPKRIVDPLAGGPEVLPSVAGWRDVLGDGARGDGVCDDTAALQAAVDAARVVYLPVGEYRLTQPLRLRAESVLLGLHPGRTQLVLRPGTTAFAEASAPCALLETDTGGACVVRGVGLRTGDHPGAVGVRWRAGPASLCEDLYFHAPFRGRDPARERSGHSLWITDGGAGEFRNIWSADVAAESGLCIEETAGPVRGLMLSIEHHREREVWLRRACNVDLTALQTEENDLSPHTVAVVTEDCSGVRIANGFFYRVRSLDTPPAQAVLVRSGRDLVFDNIHVFSWGPHPFVNALLDEPTGRFVRHRDFVRLRLRAD
ncbi:MAG: hypothetical protein JJU00_02560 [Opitutales bacterium]|nr:hypothetical protein [Opitutales bacterium]